jgi:hypothetical protein
MHIPTILLLPLLSLTGTLAQFPTTSPEELIALRYPAPASTPTATPDTDSALDGDLSKRFRPHALYIYVCNQEHWRGNCWLAPQRGNDCQNWDTIHSIGPDNGVACDVFEGEDCKGKMAMKFVTYPGEVTTPRGSLKSFRCGSH